MTDTKPSIAFIGLGIMGGPMAANLVKAGYAVTGYNRSRGKVDALVEAGGTGADSIAEAVADADVIITIVPDSPDVEQIATAADGIFAHARSGAVWIDCSSIRPDVSVKLAEQAAEKGVKAVDAPVSGGEAGAIEATLSIMVGGEAEVVESVRPVL
ncbi:MAG TPA: NAD(P)-binding domain-containing protein, partial [Microlunatus sp.]